MKASGKSRTCIQIADYGELCYLDQQCEFRLGLYAECKNSQCACKNDSHYVVNENACYKSSSKLAVVSVLIIRLCGSFLLTKTIFHA